MPPATRGHAPRTPAPVRREQLVRSAVDRFAADGYQDVELRDIAADVGVTRNLIHHYFPGGKSELYLAAVRLACAELADALDVSDEVPLDTKMPANIAGYLDQILAPAPAYVLYARATHSADDDVRAAAAATRSAIAAGVARNHLGTDSPPAAVLAALVAYIAFAETAGEQWRTSGLRDRTHLEQLLADVLVALVASVAT